VAERAGAMTVGADNRLLQHLVAAAPPDIGAVMYTDAARDLRPPLTALSTPAAAALQPRQNTSVVTARP